MSISINPNFNNSQNQKINFKADSENKPRGKNYYTYVSDKFDTSKTSPWAISGAYFLGIFGLSFLSTHIASKLVNKHLPKSKFKGLISITAAVAGGVIATVLGQNLVVNKKRLKPISKEEQAQKEKQIEKTVTDLTKQKDIKLNGIKFYDFNKNGNDNLTMAAFDYQTGYMLINTKYTDTNLDTKESVPFILHELTHAKQFELIARSDNGLTRLNKIILRSEIAKKKQDELNKILATEDKDIPALAKINIHKTDGTYNLTNEELDEKCEINKLKAIKMYLKNPDTPDNELPMMIDTEYYNKIIKDKPPLSSEEKQKVQTYLAYMESDKYINAQKGKVGKSIKSTNAYFDNPIEKEAYAAQFDYIKTGKI